MFPAAAAPQGTLPPPAASDNIIDEHATFPVDPPLSEDSMLGEPETEPLKAEYSEDTESIELWCNDNDLIKQMVRTCIQDFDMHDDKSKVSQDAAKITRSSITEGTQEGHMRVIQHYITYHKKRNPSWDAKAITQDTPNDIRIYIQEKCGSKKDGYQGCRYATAVAVRAALTYWYKHVRKIEDTSEWRIDSKTGACYGLPMRSQVVAKYMIGLEKTKAKEGEVQQSVKAMTVEVMRQLFYVCVMDPDLTDVQRRQGIVRYNAYLIAFLMMLRIDEVTSLKFEYLNHADSMPGCFDIVLPPRKASQAGTYGRWRLWANDRDTYLCPKRMQMMLAVVYGEKFEYLGLMFRQIDSSGAVQVNKPMTAGQMSRLLARDLQAIREADWALYGTHSFRRGGAQYRLSQGWSIGKVAHWGGWSQVEAITMFRYFYSPRDWSGHKNTYDRNPPMPLSTYSFNDVTAMMIQSARERSLMNQMYA